ncbi:MAG: tRNA preQ1(34) S-adenosylmethionine ribosyltransferase-isomerase QueA [Planctomycetes bacterium]|nr:tRNA preQ1(34) S-adenosylmethionine ribosyltransferase-isomerase QueA [Planctomycetota bacterium]
MRVDELDYELPDELIAHHAVQPRRSSRLLVVEKAQQHWSDRRFEDLPDLLRPDDVLVLNNTRVLPAKFYLRRKTGGRIEGLWCGRDDDGTWQVLLRRASRLKIGEVLEFEGRPEAYEVVVADRGERGAYRLTVRPESDPGAVLAEVGQTPLPHYIQRKDTQNERVDRERYQTVYAREPGAVAAPTAGLHFDTALLETLRSKGVGVVELTLHVGPGTFQPLKSDQTEDHTMHAERYAVAQDAWDTIQQAKGAGQRIVSVGTTSARVLETVAQTGRLSGETDIFIYPPYAFAMVDALLTNFHLPRSTLLAMIYAFGGTDLMRRVYAHGIEQEYRFYSYGDAMLIE